MLLIVLRRVAGAGKRMTLEDAFTVPTRNTASYKKITGGAMAAAAVAGVAEAGCATRPER